MKKSNNKVRFMGFATVLLIAALAQAKVQPPKDVISMDAARKTATDSTPGQVQSEKLENEDGKWVYAFDLKSTSDSKIHEVQVDARSGKLVSINAESDDKANEHENEENEAD